MSRLSHADETTSVCVECRRDHRVERRGGGVHILIYLLIHDDIVCQCRRYYRGRLDDDDDDDGGMYVRRDRSEADTPAATSGRGSRRHFTIR